MPVFAGRHVMQKFGLAEPMLTTLTVELTFIGTIAVSALSIGDMVPILARNSIVARHHNISTVPAQCTSGCSSIYTTLNEVDARGPQVARAHGGVAEQARALRRPVAVLVRRASPAAAAAYADLAPLAAYAHQLLAHLDELHQKKHQLLQVLVRAQPPGHLKGLNLKVESTPPVVAAAAAVCGIAATSSAPCGAATSSGACAAATATGCVASGSAVCACCGYGAYSGCAGCVTSATSATSASSATSAGCATSGSSVTSGSCATSGATATCVCATRAGATGWTGA
ncbi:hypothetical protein FIBSPDRAFT_1052061 [Athelia psychrophila]|uniref:Uncharacterized protein n=1 Tax=Athelia psychrophila TaxID=1759441 RepID=A0A165XW21_9AGAM|nr:hypothetical protein FIBSPDRAFT_1052061 [Fibularhizoctonia sp. CBS 109695]